MLDMDSYNLFHWLMHHEKEFPWISLSNYPLVVVRGYDSVMVVVDKNTKLGHFFPTKETIDSQDSASLYLHHIWKHHGTPDDVISNVGQYLYQNSWGDYWSYFASNHHQQQLSIHK